MLLLLIQSYLIGSIPFAYIFAWNCRRIDIRKIGSQNVGTTNVFQQIGVIPGVLTALLDVFKGVVVVLLGRSLGLAGEFTALLAAMVGHNWPVWLRFHGGGGLATFIGGLFVVSKWWLIIAMLGMWGVTYKVMNSHDRSALVACAICPFLLGGVHLSWNYFLLGLGAALIIGIKRVFSIKKNKCIIRVGHCG